MLVRFEHYCLIRFLKLWTVTSLKAWWMKLSFTSECQRRDRVCISECDQVYRTLPSAQKLKLWLNESSNIINSMMRKITQTHQHFNHQSDKCFHLLHFIYSLVSSSYKIFLLITRCFWASWKFTLFSWNWICGRRPTWTHTSTKSVTAIMSRWKEVNIWFSPFDSTHLKQTRLMLNDIILYNIEMIPWPGMARAAVFIQRASDIKYIYI